MIDPIVSKARRYSDRLNAHARVCIKSRKVLDECATCQAAIAWYASLPLPVLALVLQDYPTSHTRQ